MRILVLIAIAAVAACATQSKSPEAPQPASAVEDDGVSGRAAPGAAKESANSQGFKVPADYKVKQRGDTTVYCRDEVVIGSRFPTEYCFTLADLKDLEARKKSMQDDVARRQRACTTASACGGG